MSRKFRIYKILPVLIITFILSACENSTENNPPPDNTTTFPNKVGDQWIYAIHDSLTNTIDTISVNIVRTISVNGKELTVWARKSNMYNDTLYVNIDKDTVNFYTDPYPNVADQKIVFPLEAGKYWINHSRVSDSSIVENTGTVAVPAGTFSGAYRIVRNWGGFNVYGYSVTWFEDNIGIVKMYRRIQGFDNIKETWELISYTVQ